MRWRRRVSVSLLLTLLLAVSPVSAHADLNGAINAYRASAGLSALATSELLETVAHQRASEVAQPGGFHHVDLAPRVGCGTWGEIIAVNNAGDPIAWAVDGQWANSPPHEAVMLGGWTWIGSGTYADGADTYLVVLFLKPCGEPIVEEIPDTSMEAR